jgi:hypothetical protein
MPFIRLGIRAMTSIAASLEQENAAQPNAPDGIGARRLTYALFICITLSLTARHMS